MMDRRSGRMPLIALVITCVAFTVIFHPNIGLHPGAFLFTDGGDGIKNYFTFAWHVQQGDDALHFTGTNHPFGDHVFFADAHPWLAILLQQVPLPQGVEITLLNVLLLLGILLLPALCIHGILRHYGVGAWPSAFAAFAITLLQPQLSRVGGHLSLAHAWIIPLGWLLTLKFISGNQILHAILATLTGILAFLTHPYLGLMLCGMVGILLLINSISKIRSLKIANDVVVPVLLTTIPIGVFFMLLNGADVLNDRPEKPAQPDEHHTTWQSFVHPSHELAGKDPWTIRERTAWETQVYPGLATLIIAPLSLIALCYMKLFKRSWRMPRDGLFRSLLAAGILLLFSTGTLGLMIGEDGMLAQFRATGRFAWPFWFALTTATIIWIYRWAFSGNAAWRRWVFIAAMLLHTAEGIGQHLLIGRYYGYQSNNFNPDRTDENWNDLVTAIEATHAYGIIPLPLPNIGTEYYDREPQPEAMRMMFPLSYRSEVPLKACVTSRVSHSQARDLLALIAPPGHPKRLKHDIPKDATFILAWSGEDLDQDESELFERGELLKRTSIAELRTISHSELFKDASSIDLSALHMKMKDDRELLLKGAEMPDDLALGQSGEGAVNEYFFLVERPPHSLHERYYELSFQYRLLDKEALRCWLVLETNDDGPVNSKWEATIPLMSAPMQYEDRLIMRYRFEMKDTKRWMRFVLIGPTESAAKYEVDNVLLRPADLEVWQKMEWFGDTILFKNNVPTASDHVRSQAP
jgi:hypothetical protein